VPARLRCAAGSANSAASLRANSAWRFMIASQGAWSGSPVFGAFTKVIGPHRVVRYEC
jgi:hypothetical protein